MRDQLAAKGISGAYGNRLDGGANPKVQPEKDNGTRVGPDVSTLSPAFEPGKQPWDFKTKQEAMSGIQENKQGNKQRVIYDGSGGMVFKNGIYSDPYGQPVNDDPNKKRPADDEAPHGEVNKADVVGFQRSGPVDPAPEPLSGRNEAQIDRLAEGVAIGIMSKINPKPYDSGGPSGPIVIPGNPIADPLEPPVPKRTNIKPRKPDGPVGPGGNSPLTPGSGGLQASDPNDPQADS